MYFASGIVIRPRMHGETLVEIAIFSKGSGSAELKMYQDWNVRQELGQWTIYGRYRVVNKVKRRILRIVKVNRKLTEQLIAANLNQGSTQSISELMSRRIMHRMD
ncbi:hypothetical protein NPIL_156421 [Nephila pilipes]|uniref:Uncharacterized protein n=1 Tax=Nephila pilipes TaxID=299642 RepID=A0A8X6QS28_NEPPI|nr:hypothetical protein NPIL_156421 [Nephila pilipes]